MKYAFSIIFLLLCTSCWRMPKDGEVSTIPVTNNSSVIHKTPEGSVMPEVEY